MNDFIKSLPGWAKGTLAIGGMVAVGVVSWRIYKAVKEKKAGESSQKTVDEANDSFASLSKKGESLSFPKSNYNSACNTIEKLLDGCETAQSEIQAIVEVAKVVVKPIDWFYLISVFGKRKISDCGSFGMSSEMYDLPTLLKDQLDTATDYSINVNGFKKFGFTINSLNILVEYLETKGITL